MRLSTPTIDKCKPLTHLGDDNKDPCGRRPNLRGSGSFQQSTPLTAFGRAAIGLARWEGDCLVLYCNSTRGRFPSSPHGNFSLNLCVSSYTDLLPRGICRHSSAECGEKAVVSSQILHFTKDQACFDIAQSKPAGLSLDLSRSSFISVKHPTKVIPLQAHKHSKTDFGGRSSVSTNVEEVGGGGRCT